MMLVGQTGPTIRVTKQLDMFKMAELYDAAKNGRAAGILAADPRLQNAGASGNAMSMAVRTFRRLCVF